MTALQGTAGVGKTSMAAWLVHDPAVQLRYPDGIFWLTIGNDADIAAKKSELQRVLFSSTSASCGETPALQRLVVLDDVWKDEHVQAFDDLVSGGTDILLYNATRTSLMILRAAAVACCRWRRWQRHRRLHFSEITWGSM